MKEHIVIVRTGANVIDFNSYNCQELGQAKALARRGYKVSLIMAGYATSQKSVSVGENKVDVFLLKVKAIDIRLGFFIGIDILLKRIEPTILQVHDMGIYMTWWVSNWARIHHVKCFLIQGVYQLSPKLLAGQLDRFVTWFFGSRVLKNVDGIGCKSYFASNYVRKYSNKDTKIVCVGLDESKFSNLIEHDWREELMIAGKRVLLYVGRIEERRNPLLLLEIMKLLSDEYVLLIVGKGPQSDLLEKRIEEEHLDNRVFLLGMKAQSELPSIYKAADLFLLASSYEIYGMVIMESMFFGLPVISSHSGGAEIIISNKKDGFIEESFNASDWASTIKSICSNEKQLQLMKEQSKHKIEEQFLWDKSVDTFLDLYGV